MRASKFDELLDKLGTGKWNILYFFTAGFWYMWLPGEFFGGVYLTPEIGYTCVVPENASLVEISPDSCHYVVNETSEYGEDVPVELPCTSWTYDDSVYTSTLTSEFDLVCDRAYLKATFQSSLVFATMFTSVFAGYLADRFGRKNVVVVTQILFSVTSISISLATNFSSVLALRFITGAFFLPTTYVLAMEVCEIKNRSLVGILTGLPWAIGTMMWGAFAYLVRSWRYLRLTMTLPPLLLFPCLYLIDESPRWLILRGDHTRALKVLRKAARWNNVELPPDNELKQTFLDIQIEMQRMRNEGASIESLPRCMILRQDEKDFDNGRSHDKKIHNVETFIDRSRQQAKIEKKATKGKEGRMTFCRNLTLPKLIRTPKIRLITCILSLMMFMVSLSYTGVSLSGNLYGNDPFIYMVLLGVTQTPSYTVTAPIIKWFGRRRPVIVCFLVGGVSMIALGFVPSTISWLVLTLAMIGMLCFSSAWMMMAVYLTELLPTEVRMQGMGTTTVFCQISGTIAPYITLYLGPIVPWIPSVVYGIACFIAAAAAIPLDETKGAPMLETIEDLERRSRRPVRTEPPETEGETTKFDV